MIVGISILTFFDVKVSMAILGVALIGEVVDPAIFAIGVFTNSAAACGHRGLNPFNAFQGFDAHENDARTNTGGRRRRHRPLLRLLVLGRLRDGAELWRGIAGPQAHRAALSLYLGTGLGIFYVIVSGRGLGLPKIDDAIAMAQTNSAQLLPRPTAESGKWATMLMSCLILTSAFACGMAFHNTAARYLYSLGREGVLPAALGDPPASGARMSPRYPVGARGRHHPDLRPLMGTDDPTKQAYLGVYGLMALVGTMLIMASQALVSVAIIAYFMKHHPDDHHWWETLVAPVIALV